VARPRRTGEDQRVHPRRIGGPVALTLPRLSEPDAGRLAEALGDLPLAVDQTAALLLDTGWTVADGGDLAR
jgi:hypothetical protein